MKLFYYETPHGNVGDDLNQWLWPQLLPKVLDDDPRELVVGIGTILNSRLPSADKYYILSSGYGYHEQVAYNPKTWDVRALRGPLTQEALGVEGSVCLLDGAYLLPRFLPPQSEKKHRVAFIPHVDSMLHGEWEKVCAIAGVKLLDPRWPVQRFVAELCECEQVVTEAMHGAILADAYDVPWLPVKAYDYILDFKWQDWASSLDMKVQFQQLPPTWKGDSREHSSNKRYLINTVKRGVEKLGLFPKSWTPVPAKKTSERELHQIAQQLTSMAAEGSFALSDTRLRQGRTDLLLEEVHRLNQQGER